MTPADIVAEAIAFAKEATSDRVRNHPRTTWLSGDVEGMTVLDPVRYHRDDVVDAALAHLAARAAEAEGRAERAEAEAFDLIRLHEASKTVLILKAVEVADAWSGFNESLSSRLHDELGALDLDDVAKKMIAEQDASASTRCTCEHGCPHGAGCRYVEEDAEKEAGRG